METNHDAASCDRESYHVGIICALAVERAAVEATLDDKHANLAKVHPDEDNYTFGRIGKHNVVIACLPAGGTGKTFAITAAVHMKRSFRITVGLLVGICGGVWTEEIDIRLGDVIVSQPDGMHGGIVQHDYGKMEAGGVFRRTGMLNKPSKLLLGALEKMKTTHMQHGNGMDNHLQKMFRNNPAMAQMYRHQGQDNDQLFEADYHHPAGHTCAGCDRSRLVQSRPERKDSTPRIHYGNVASGDQVMKDGIKRDRIARREGILCFEMEAAGLIEIFPCIVIRGVSDYADSHKNERWQPYAAATAAAFAKEFLHFVSAEDVNWSIQDTIGRSHRAINQSKMVIHSSELQAGNHEISWSTLDHSIRRALYDFSCMIFGAMTVSLVLAAFNKGVEVLLTGRQSMDKMIDESRQSAEALRLSKAAMEDARNNVDSERETLESVQRRLEQGNSSGGDCDHNPSSVRESSECVTGLDGDEATHTLPESVSSETRQIESQLDQRPLQLRYETCLLRYIDDLKDMHKQLNDAIKDNQIELGRKEKALELEQQRRMEIEKKLVNLEKQAERRRWCTIL